MAETPTWQTAPTSGPLSTPLLPPTKQHNQTSNNPSSTPIKSIIAVSPPFNRPRKRDYLTTSSYWHSSTRTVRKNLYGQNTKTSNLTWLPSLATDMQALTLQSLDPSGTQFRPPNYPDIVTSTLDPPATAPTAHQAHLSGSTSPTKVFSKKWLPGNDTKWSNRSSKLSLYYHLSTLPSPHTTGP